MRWTSESIEELLLELRDHGRDFEDVEVKLGTGGVPELGDTLCAFGNMPNGGTIIVGLDEERGFLPVGVPDPGLIEQSIASQARNALVPPLHVSFSEADVDGATLVIATVAALPSSQRPCRYQGRAYLRQADGDYVMSELEIQQMIALRERPRYDARPVDGTSFDDLEPSLVSEFVSAARIGSRRLASETDEVILTRKAVLASDGQRLTTAGLYALGRYPQQFLPSLSITAAVLLDPRSGQRTRDRVDLDGPLPEMLEGALEWVQRNTLTTTRFGPDGHGRDATELPMVAVRELIANALVHRDLGPHSWTQRVEIRLRADELVISNPGGLYGVSLQQLGTPTGKSAVNEFLYDICKLARTESGNRVIEGEGGGIREVQRSLKAANMRPPRFSDAGVRFTAILPRHSLLDPNDIEWLTEHDPTASLTSVQQQIVTSMRHGQNWTNALVREEFAPIDSRDARAALQGLVNLGLATVTGERGQTEYMIDPAYSAFGLGTRPQVTVRPPAVEAAAEQDPLPEAPGEPTEGLTRNAPVIWSALLDGPRSFDQILRETSLSERQARYALEKLRAAGFITVEGGQGVRETTYSRTDAGLASNSAKTADQSTTPALPNERHETEALVAELAKALAETGSAVAQVSAIKASPEDWRRAARKAARTLRRPVETLAGGGVLVAALRDWPRDEREEADMRARQRAAVEAAWIEEDGASREQQH